MIARPAFGAFAAMAALGLGGCQSITHSYVPEAPPKAEKIVFDPTQGTSLFPLNMGNQWTFQLTVEEYDDQKLAGTMESELTYRVVSSKKVGDATKSVLEMVQNDEVTDRQTWLINDRGMYQTTASPKDVPFKPAQIEVPFPVHEKETFDWAGSGERPDGSEGYQDTHSRILASESVDTDMGPFMAIPVETDSTYEGRGSISTVWFHPGLGIVRFWQQLAQGNRRIVTILTLKNYALKQS